MSAAGQFRRFELPNAVRFEDAAGGLARAVTSTPPAEAQVYLQGAHLTHDSGRVGRHPASANRAYQRVVSMRFLPNSRASMDQAPGPTIARLAPNAASMIGGQGFPGLEYAIHASTRTTRTPATGVHKPARRRIPATAPIVRGTNTAHADGAVRQAISR